MINFLENRRSWANLSEKTLIINLVNTEKVKLSTTCCGISNKETGPSSPSFDRLPSTLKSYDGHGRTSGRGTPRPRSSRVHRGTKPQDARLRRASSGTAGYSGAGETISLKNGNKVDNLIHRLKIKRYNQNNQEPHNQNNQEPLERENCCLACCKEHLLICCYPCCLLCLLLCK